ncbi:hypothetical protein FIA58_019450 [Flavobacterium jejuense]|uniref:Uncharacterized protein n=1 Tax=Flavobacterium jejuense TaxID=1544455 RepID=A0ABX0IYE3_9FLAO|nr:hypothetical protein [Flavobacterium jejuense]NHN27859.1 hypothetical protein [Flavobacterium jejuense]
MSKTNQKDSSCTPVIPAGVLISDVKVTNLGFQITFPNPRHDKPLPPIAQVTINADSNMEISIVVFVSKKTDVDLENLYVIQQFSYTNEQIPFANFYVCYDAVPKLCSVFNVFQLTFNAINSSKGYTPNMTLPNDMPMPDILDLKEIVSFLWDEDPKLSRGTVTTVQQA